MQPCLCVTYLSLLAHRARFIPLPVLSAKHGKMAHKH